MQRLKLIIKKIKRAPGRCQSSHDYGWRTLILYHITTKRMYIMPYSLIYTNMILDILSLYSYKHAKIHITKGVVNMLLLGRLWLVAIKMSTATSCMRHKFVFFIYDVKLRQIYDQPSVILKTTSNTSTDIFLYIKCIPICRLQNGPFPSGLSVVTL